MIIVKLVGGLGNQMFQYAIGRRLALYHGTELKLDTSFFSDAVTKNDLPSTEKTTPRKYELDKFNIVAGIATENDISLFRHQAKWAQRAKKFLTQSKYITESSYRFDPAYLQFGKNCCLNGYWQSEQYFKDIGDTIRNEFQCRSALDEANTKMEAFIKSTNAVSIHVRRGDYVNNPATGKFHGICSEAYYQKAAALLSEKVPSPHFFIFSDDTSWVQKNLILNHPATVVNINDENSGTSDLRLMSACKHNIIANSSFSWWGAWLNNNDNKIVAGPVKWFNDPSVDTSTVLPADWHKL